MNINLFKRELKSNGTALLIWTITISGLVILTMSIYRVFLENHSKILGMMTIVPKGALQFKGISNVDDLFSVLGFYTVNNVIYMLVLGSIYSVVLASGIILKEEYNKTAEYLLSRPVTRGEVYISKAAVVFVNITILNLVASIAGLITMYLVKTEPFNIHSFIVLVFYSYLLNILFGAAGIFISTMIKRAKPVTTFSIGLVLVMYFIYTLSKITEGVSSLGYITPYRFVNMDTLQPGYHLEAVNMVYFTGLTVLLVFISFRRYLKKDIYL